MENIVLHVGLVNYSQKRFEICEYNCTMLPNGMYKLPDKLSLPKDGERLTAAIHESMLGKRIYINRSSHINFVYYSLDKNEVTYTMIKSKEAYIKLQDTLIESRKKDIKEIQKQITKYEKRKETIDNDFTMKSVDVIRGVLRE